MEQFANSDTTTLNGSITSGSASITVTSATLFPTSGTFSLSIDSELMEVTGVSGTTFAVTRGTEGTSAASHSNGATVANPLTARSLAQFRADNVSEGTEANLPAAGAAGRIYLPNNGFYAHYDNGSSWDYFGPLFKLTPPVLGNFGWVNQGGCTATTTSGGIILASAAGIGSDNVGALVKTYPTAPHTFTIGFIPNIVGSQFNRMGLTLYDSGSGKLIMFSVIAVQESNSPPAMLLALEKFASVTSFSANYNFLHGNSVLAFPAGQIVFMRLYDDGTTRHWQISFDSVSWIEVSNQGNTDYITPTSIGFHIDPQNSSIGLAMTLLHQAG